MRGKHDRHIIHTCILYLHSACHYQPLSTYCLAHLLITNHLLLASRYLHSIAAQWQQRERGRHLSTHPTALPSLRQPMHGGMTFLSPRIALLINLNRDVDSYMDEIFHVPKAQRFCSGDFSNYDPKITTPPGLYILSLLMYKSIRIFSNRIGCSATFLRVICPFLKLIKFERQMQRLH